MHDLADDSVMSPHTDIEANHFQLEAMFEAFLSSPQAPQTVFTKHSPGPQNSAYTYQLDAEVRKCHLSAILLRFTGPLEDVPGGATQKCMHHPNTLTLNAC